MSTFQDLAKTFEKLFKTRKDLELPAFLGNLSGTVKADDANHVYVTLLPSGEVRTVYNGKVPNVPRLPVIIGYSNKSNQFEILRARDVYVTPAYPEVPPHALLHTFPGVDTIPIRGEQFLPGLVTPAGGVTVKVYGFSYQLADGWHVVPTQTVDLSAHVPSDGALYVLLQVDDSGAVTLTDGTAVDTREELGFDDIPASDPDQYVVAAIKLYNSQTELIFTATDTDIVDLRWGRAVNIAALIHAATADTAPEDTDEFGFWDSVTGLLNRITWANIKATLKTYFDTLYVALTGNQTIAGVKTFSSDPIIPDEAYDATAWNGNLEPPTKNAVRDKIESMGSGDWVLISDSVLGASAANFDLTSIPATYKHLHIDYSLRSDRVAASDRIKVVINNDTGSNKYESILYFWYHTSTWGTTTIGSTTFAEASFVCAASALANSFGGGFINFVDYANTTNLKLFQTRGGQMQSTTIKPEIYDGMAVWRDTAAITRITISPEFGSNWVAGSRVTLYGKK